MAMDKVTRISGYEQLSDEELIAEVKQRRREIQQPKLDWKDTLSNFLISTSVVGFGIASTVGVVMNIFNPTKDGFSESLKGLYESEDRKGFLNSKSDFKRTLITSTALFTGASLIAAPIVNYFQKSERSEDNATKHLFGKDELFRRGYMQTKVGDFVKMNSSFEVRNEQKKLLHRVDELENQQSFSERERAKSEKLEEKSPMLR